MTNHSKGKSAVINGARLFLRDVDARGERARVFRDVLESLLSQLPGASTAEDQLCRRASGLAMIGLDLEAELVGGEVSDALQTRYENLCTSLRRVLAALKLPAGLPTVADDDDRPKTLAEFMKARNIDRLSPGLTEYDGDADADVPEPPPEGNGELMPRKRRRKGNGRLARKERRPNLDNFKDPKHDDR